MLLSISKYPPFGRVILSIEVSDLPFSGRYCHLLGWLDVHSVSGFTIKLSIVFSILRSFVLLVWTVNTQNDSIDTDKLNRNNYSKHRYNPYCVNKTWGNNQRNDVALVLHSCQLKWPITPGAECYLGCEHSSTAKRAVLWTLIALQH